MKRLNRMVLKGNCSHFLVTFFMLPDINECAPDGLTSLYSYYAHDCHDDANCSNTEGSYFCSCLVGFSGNGVTCLGKTNIYRESIFLNNDACKDTKFIIKLSNTELTKSGNDEADYVHSCTN